VRGSSERMIAAMSHALALLYLPHCTSALSSIVAAIASDALFHSLRLDNGSLLALYGLAGLQILEIRGTSHNKSNFNF